MDRDTRAVFDATDWPVGQCYESQAAYEQMAVDAKMRSLFRHLVMQSSLLDIDAVRRAAEILGLELDQ
jgi:hypothetical protein